MRIFAQHAVHIASTCRSQDFAPIVLADRCRSVGEKNAGLEKIQPSEKLYAVERKESLRQIRETKIETPEAALISDVMNGQNRVERQGVCMHDNGQQRWRPIVH